MPRYKITKMMELEEEKRKDEGEINNTAICIRLKLAPTTIIRIVETTNAMKLKAANKASSRDS